MLSITNISKSYGPRLLFTDVSFSIVKGDRVAIVGQNGVGKTTLLSIILGNEEADTGEIALVRGTTVGFLPQEAITLEGNRTVLEVAISVTDEHAELRRKISELEKNGERDTENYRKICQRYRELGAYELEPKAAKILRGLAFREADFDRPVSSMSGGWMMRAYIARLLVMQPDLLILDAPTNHLDLETLLWFQTYLHTYPGAILMISHDRTFLNALVGSVLELRNKHLQRFRGNYDSYLEQRKALVAQQWAAYKNQQQQIATLQRFVDRFGAKATKAAQAQSKLKQIERMDIVEAPENDEKTMDIDFPQPEPSGQRVLTLENVYYAYGDLVVYQDLNLTIERGERIVFIGPNGAGKSTLLKILASVLTVQQGKRTLGHKVTCGYYSQNRLDMLTPENTVLEEAMSIPNPPLEVTVRSVLGSFLFSEDDVFKKVSVLSGGEKSRLALVKILLNPPNLLLMDEPTIHLDIASSDVLIDALKQYGGTLVFISHDVTFIRALAQKVLHISAGKITPYAGGYDYYLQKNAVADERQGLFNARPEETKDDSGNLTTREQKKLENQKRREETLRKREETMRLNRLEREIMALETKIQELTAQLEDPTVYSDHLALRKLNDELTELQTALAEKYSLWESLAP